MMEPPRVCLAWYFHLPWVATDAEVEDLVRESLRPLITTHAHLGAPFVLAITGVLLERIAANHADLIDEIRALMDSGVVEIAGCFFHEVLPPTLPPSELESHAASDLEPKQLLFGHRPEVFFPGNFAWVASLNQLLPSLGVRRTILDGSHLTRATATQRWHWSIDGETVFADSLIPLGLSRTALHQPYRLTTRDGGDLSLLFRDTAAVMAFSAGRSGAIQEPLTTAALGNAIGMLVEGGEIITLADDGDRVNALSILAYRRFLESVGPSRFVTSAAGAAYARRRLDYLPGFSIADLHRFWLADADSLHWLTALDELRRAQPELSTDPAFLRLHDVYPLFWRNHWRCRLFWQAADDLRRNLWR